MYESELLTSIVIGWYDSSCVLADIMIKQTFAILISDFVFDGCINGTAELERRDYPATTDHIWISVGGLVGMTLVLWLLTYVLLRCAKKHK